MDLKCCIFGLGYIGLPTACVLVKSGHNVIGVDINNELVEQLNNGKVNIKENGIQKALDDSLKTGNFKAGTEPISSDVYIIAVPTPFKNIADGSHEPNIDYVIDAAKSISKVIKKNQMILIESTCPVGTTKKVAELIIENCRFSDKEFSIAYCPERVLPGKILYELINNDRVVGGIKKTDAIKAKEFYETFCKGEILETNAETAELVKLTENSFRDVNIAFANELSIICDSQNINTAELINLANHHPRVNILQPGSGVGGHCIAVDPWFIISQFPNEAKLIKTGREVNLHKTNWIINKIIEESKHLELKKGTPIKVGCMGIAFKPDVNDFRESPALKIATELSKLNTLEIYSCDPNIESNIPLKMYSIDETLEKCDLLVFLVAHSVFKKINLSKLKFLDYCNLKK